MRITEDEVKVGTNIRFLGGKDIEIGQHLRAVDADVESARTRRVKESLGKVQAHGLRGPRVETGDRVGEISNTSRLVDLHRRGIRDATQINRFGMVDGASATASLQLISPGLRGYST